MRVARHGRPRCCHRPRCQRAVLESLEVRLRLANASVSLSYTPWLRKLVNDIFLANLLGYWKMGCGDNQALSASLRYFSLGE